MKCNIMACQEDAASLELVMKTVGEDVYWFNPSVLLKTCNSLKENYSLNTSSSEEGFVTPADRYVNVPRLWQA